MKIKTQPKHTRAFIIPRIDPIKRIQKRLKDKNTHTRKETQLKLPFAKTPNTLCLLSPSFFLSIFFFASRSCTTLLLSCSLDWKLIEELALPPLFTAPSPWPRVLSVPTEDSERLLEVARRRRVGTLKVEALPEVWKASFVVLLVALLARATAERSMTLPMRSRRSTAVLSSSSSSSEKSIWESLSSTRKDSCYGRC